MKIGIMGRMGMMGVMLMGLGARGATPSYSNFNTNQFQSNSFVLSLRTNLAFTNLNVGNLGLTNGIWFGTNAWPGPTNYLDMLAPKQFYVAPGSVEVTNFDNLLEAQTRRCDLAIWNTQATNIVVRWPAAVYAHDGQQSATCTNGMGMIVTFEAYSHWVRATAVGITNANLPAQGQTFTRLTIVTNGANMDFTAVVRGAAATDPMIPALRLNQGIGPYWAVQWFKDGSLLSFTFPPDGTDLITVHASFSRASLGAGSHTFVAIGNPDDSGDPDPNYGQSTASVTLVVP